MYLNTLDLWNSLGTAWQTFQDKPLIEALWSGLAISVDTVNAFALEVQKSRSLEYMSPLIDVGPEMYTIIYSGLATEVNVTLTSVPGDDNLLTENNGILSQENGEGLSWFSILTSGVSFSYALDNWTYSIPELLVNYKYRNVTYSGLYTEGNQYIISDLSYITWGDILPVPDIRYPDTCTLIAYAPHVWQINPVLMETWARFCGLDYATFLDYDTYGQSALKHLKMLIWGLVYKQMCAPSIKTLKDAYGLARGLPFAYAAGNLTSTIVNGLCNISIGNDLYIMPSGVQPIASGYVDQFDLIASGLNLWDYKTKPTLAIQHGGIFAARNTLIYQLDSTLSGINYSQEFFDTYISKIMPEQVQYYKI